MSRTRGKVFEDTRAFLGLGGEGLHHVARLKHARLPPGDLMQLSLIHIWENKAHLVRPALAPGDGPFMKFRKWASQFYVEPMQSEAMVFPPSGSFPAEGERELTASKKFGTPDPAFKQ